MSAYTPYPITEFKTGINTYLQPWQRPIDSFEPLVNAYINRGCINKRNGFSQYGNQVPDAKPIMGIMQWLNESNGVNSLVVATTQNLYVYVDGSNTFVPVGMPPTFTGTIINFFNSTNWQSSTGAPSLLWMTNNIDPITTYDGTNSNQPVLAIDSSMTPNTITTALDVKVYKQRLLYIKPTYANGGSQNQTIAWSAQFDGANAKQDVAGNGGFADAPTGDIIQSAEFIRDVLVVAFSNSTWIFRFTGNQSDPFRWDKVNITKNTNCPYASLAYDERITNIGNTGLTACDAVNVQRYDIPIIDYYETNFSQNYYAQAYSQRYDNLNQSWSLYVSAAEPFPLVGGVAPGSDQALIYNFIENSWATYQFPIPLTCMGLYKLIEGDTWEDADYQWTTQDYPWFTYSSTKGSPIILAGSTNGFVYYMDDDRTVSDNEVKVVEEVIAVGSGVTTYSGTLPTAPIAPAELLPGLLTIQDPVEKFTSTANGILIGDQGGSGTINYETGAFSVTFNTAVPTATDITANYLNGIPIEPDIISTRWNPAIAVGQAIQFGHIDIYYQVVSENPLNPIQVTLNFYVDNRLGYALQKTLTLDGPEGTDYAFKRIYLNLQGQFVRMEIESDNVNSVMKFAGFILWARPSGRLTGP